MTHYRDRPGLRLGIPSFWRSPAPPRKRRLTYPILLTGIILGSALVVLVGVILENLP